MTIAKRNDVETTVVMPLYKLCIPQCKYEESSCSWLLFMKFVKIIVTECC